MTAWGLVAAVALIAQPSPPTPSAAWVLTPSQTETSSAATIRVGVLPVRGDADAAGRGAVERAIVEAMRDLEGLEPVSLSSLGAVFGAQAVAALEACTDDACRAREVTSRIAVDRLVAASLDKADGGRLRLRLIDPQRPRAPVARVTRAASLVDPGPSVGLGVAELFPEAAAASLATVEVRGGYDGAIVQVDGVQRGTMQSSPLSPRAQAVLRLRPGPHRIEVTYPGHFPFAEEVTARVGEPVVVRVSLKKNRSSGPLIVGGAGLVLIGAAGIVGLTAQQTADDWQQGCSGVVCAPGFTRDRYETDRNHVENGRNVSNGLLITGAAAVVGAVLWYLLDPGSDPDERGR